MVVFNLVVNKYIVFSQPTLLTWLMFVVYGECIRWVIFVNIFWLNSSIYILNQKFQLSSYKCTLDHCGLKVLMFDLST